MVEKVDLPEGVSKEEAKEILSTHPSIFKEIPVGYNSMIRIWKTFYKGRPLLSIQKFWRAEDNQEWQFGKAITFPEEVIEDLIEGLTKMKEYLEEC